MEWSKTFKKLGWYLLFSLLGWLGTWSTSDKVEKLIKDNPIAVLAINGISLAMYAVKDYAKHGREIIEQELKNGPI